MSRTFTLPATNTVEGTGGTAGTVDIYGGFDALLEPDETVAYVNWPVPYDPGVVIPRGVNFTIETLPALPGNPEVVSYLARVQLRPSYGDDGGVIVALNIAQAGQSPAYAGVFAVTPAQVPDLSWGTVDVALIQGRITAAGLQAGAVTGGIGLDAAPFQFSATLAVSYVALVVEINGLGVPPLRQRQRDDGIGAGAPRMRSVGVRPSSRQRSIRQGWQGTYL